jgi:hypothetical protein
MDRLDLARKLFHVENAALPFLSRRHRRSGGVPRFEAREETHAAS